MMTEPMMFITEIGSPKSKAAMHMVKMSVVPLNIYAILTSIRRSTCCQRMAYTPMMPTAPANHSKYGHEPVGCIDAIFVQIPTQAYNMLMPTKAPISLILTNSSIFNLQILCTVYSVRCIKNIYLCLSLT